MPGGNTKAVVGLLALTVLAVGAIWAVNNGTGPFADPEGCNARAAGHTVHVEPDQARNAVIIAAVAEQRGLPARAVSIAYATAYQESKLRNLDHGDRDSLGLYQQRPSQGWGTPDQVMDPYYATNKFFDALVQVEDYEVRDIGEVAQTIQRSGYPDAYDDHVHDGRTLASVLTGYDAAAFSCVVREAIVEEQTAAGGLLPRAKQVRREVRAHYDNWAEVHTVGGETAEAAVLGIEVAADATGTRRGWMIADYLLANAKDLELASVTYAGRRWTVGAASEDGWIAHGTPDASVLMVRVRS